MSTQKARLFVYFIGIGALLFVLKGQLPHATPVVPAAQERITLHVSKSNFTRYCKEYGVDPERLDDLARLRYFGGFVEQEMLFQQVLQQGSLWRDPVVQRLVLSNQEFLGVERVNPELLDDMVVNDLAIRRYVERRARHVLAYSDIADPDIAVVEQYYAAHPEQFMSDARVDFTQRVYASKEAAELALSAAGARNAQPAANGRSSLPAEVKSARRGDIGRYFGFDFADTVLRLAADDQQQGHWIGPIQSQFGFHLLNLNRFQPQHVAPFEGDTRNKALGFWRSEQREIAYRMYLQDMKARVEVQFEDREPVPFLAISAPDLKSFL